MCWHCCPGPQPARGEQEKMLGGSAAGDCPLRVCLRRAMDRWAASQQDGRARWLPAPPSFAARPGQELARTEGRAAELSARSSQPRALTASAAQQEVTFLRRAGGHRALMAARPADKRGSACTHLTTLSQQTEQHVCCMIPLFCTDREFFQNIMTHHTTQTCICYLRQL